MLRPDWMRWVGDGGLKAVDEGVYEESFRVNQWPIRQGLLLLCLISGRYGAHCTGVALLLPSST